MKLDQKFQIRIDRHTARVLKETAERAGVSQSEYLRRLILARPALQPVQEEKNPWQSQPHGEPYAATGAKP